MSVTSEKIVNKSVLASVDQFSLVLIVSKILKVVSLCQVNQQSVNTGYHHRDF